MVLTSLLRSNQNRVTLELAEYIVATIGDITIVLHAPSVGCFLEGLLDLGYGLRSTLRGTLRKIIVHVAGTSVERYE